MTCFHKILAVAILVVLTPQIQTRAQSGDPSGFTDALNVARAQRGLPAVAYQPGDVIVAAENNRLQLTFGLGHHHTAGLGQVAMVGTSGVQAAFSAWCGSPAHAGLLFAPDLVGVAYHESGGCATATTRQSFMGCAAVPVPTQATVATWGCAAPQACYPVPRRRGLFRRW